MEELLFLAPKFSHTIWGGRRLCTDFGYEEPGEDIGECWGISAHPAGDATVRDGAYAGQTLSFLWAQHPELFGNESGALGGRFPLLVKIIDAQDDLSIQVHPGDAYALEHENGSLGKTECWYILDCPEGATIVAGHNARTREELARMINEERWDELIREIPVRKGDFIQIDPGTVHAIKGGILILETQQSSDITYRLYDYGRLQNGKPRQLHLQQSIDVITVPAKSAEDSVLHMADLPENELCELWSCQYYTVAKVNGNAPESDPLRLAKDAPFLNVSILSGSGALNGRSIRKGDHLIVTAAARELALSGKLELILSKP